MAISLVGYASALGNTLTFPFAIQKGDAIVAMAGRNNNNVSPTLASGWVSLASAGTSNLSMRVAFRIADSASQSFGTWTNATGVAAYVFRPSVGSIVIPAVNQLAGTTNTPNYGSLTTVTLGDGYIDQWMGAFGSTLDNTLAIETAPTGMTFREKQSQTGYAFALFDTAATRLTTFPNTQVTLAAANIWRTTTFRIVEYPFPPFGGGGTFNPLNHPLIN